MTDQMEVKPKPREGIPYTAGFRLRGDMFNGGEDYEMCIAIRHPTNGATVAAPIETTIEEFDRPNGLKEYRFIIQLPNELKDLFHSIPVAQGRKAP